MKIAVEFLLEHESEIYTVGRVPCVGELIAEDGVNFEVKAVIHLLDVDPETQPVAIVRVV